MALVQAVVALILVASTSTAYGYKLATLCIDNHWPSGIHPHPTNCHKFIECSSGVTHEMDCPSPLAFNDAIKSCDDPFNVPACSGGGNGGSVVTTQPPQPTTQAAQRSTTQQPQQTTQPPQSTTQQPQSTTQPPQPTTQPPQPTTQPPQPTTQPPQPTTQPPQPTTQPPQPTTTMSFSKTTSGHFTKDVSDICRTDNLPNGIHEHPYDCNKYIECAFLVTYIMECSVGLVYDPAKKTCNDPSRVPTCQGAGTGSSVTTTPMTSGHIDPVTVCKDLSLSEGIHPHPTACGSFIECSAGSTYTVDCPAGLHYHSMKQACDDVHNVDCRDNHDYFSNIIIG